MIIRLKGGRIFDPANGIEGDVKDIFIEGGKIIAPPAENGKVDKTYLVTDKVIMAGGIDIHTHIGGGKVNIARMLLPEDHVSTTRAATRKTRAGSGHITPTTFLTGYRYAEMGYTACFEPAMLPANARQAHMEMADVPLVDTGAYVLLGNDDFFLRALAKGKEQGFINDYVAWIVNATQAIAVKVVNPGGINAFKFNQRKLDLDDMHDYYGVSPRRVLQSLNLALHDLGICHPLHVHGCNLGVPGNIASTLATIESSEGLPLHLTHVQFHCYGTEGDRGFSSGAQALAEAVNSNKNISIDIGQIMFGQTVTASGDTMHQYRGHLHAHPKKWVAMDIECNAGCGVVPFFYRDRNFVNALQWCIGLELFLLVEDPWRVFLTTDHPNGAPFASYPHLIRLLMDNSYRRDILLTINGAARQTSHLGELDREYSLYEIAIITRAGPARSLGLRDRGHLGPGALADICVYTDHKDRQRMFAKPALVFKDGRLVVRNGKVLSAGPGSTHRTRPGYDPGIRSVLQRYFRDFQTVSLSNFGISDDELESYSGKPIVTHACR